MPHTKTYQQFESGLRRPVTNEGSVMPGRSFSSEAYRWGFNTQEKDDEIYGSGNSYTALYWQYDARIGRRWNVDPVKKHHESPYATFANNPIWFIDPVELDTFIVTRRGRISDGIAADGDHVFVMGTRKERRKQKIEYDESGNLQERHKNISVDRNTVDISRERNQRRSKNTVLQLDLATLGVENGKSLFEFFADNTKVEWSYNDYCKKDETYNIKAILETSHRTGSVVNSNVSWSIIINYTEYHLLSDIHSHPPDFFGRHSPRASPSDKAYRYNLQNTYNRTGTIFQFYSDGVYRDFENNIHE